MKKNKTYYVALYGIMLSTIFVAMMLDRLLSATLPVSTAAVTLLVTFCFCLIRNEWLTGFFAGVFFGLASCLKEIIMPSIITTQLLSNNMWYFIPVQFLLPRLFVGIAAFATYKLMLLLLKKCKKRVLRQGIALSVGTAIGLIVNTLLFLSLLVASNSMVGVQKTLIGLLSGLTVINILPEYLISIILAPMAVLGVRRAMHYGIEAIALNSNEEDIKDTQTNEREEATELVNDVNNDVAPQANSEEKK